MSNKNAAKSLDQLGRWTFGYQPPVPLSLPVENFYYKCFENGYLKDCNSQMLSLYGYEHFREVLGKPMGAFCSPNAVETKAFFKQFYKNKNPAYTGDLVGVTKNGEKSKTKHTITRVHVNDKGELVEVSGVQHPPEPPVEYVPTVSSDSTVQLQDLSLMLSELMAALKSQTKEDEQAIKSFDSNLVGLLQLRSQVEEIQKTVYLLRVRVIEGNGTKSLSTRVDMLEHAASIKTSSLRFWLPTILSILALGMTVLTLWVTNG